MRIRVAMKVLSMDLEHYAVSSFNEPEYDPNQKKKEDEIQKKKNLWITFIRALCCVFVCRWTRLITIHTWKYNESYLAAQHFR